MKQSLLGHADIESLGTVVEGISAIVHLTFDCDLEALRVRRDLQKFCEESAKQRVLGCEDRFSYSESAAELRRPKKLAPSHVAISKIL